MKYRRCGILFLTVAMLTLTACDGAGEKEKETKSDEETSEYYDGSLSDEEMEADHLLVEFSEKVSVDADITPYSEYKDGLSIYRTDLHWGDKKVKFSDLKKNPSVFGKSLEELQDILNREVGGKFDDSKESVRKVESDLEVTEELTGSDGLKRKFSLVQPFDTKTGKTYNGRVYLDIQREAGDEDEQGQTADEMGQMSDEIGQMSDEAVGRSAIWEQLSSGATELSFGSKEEIGQKAKQLVTDLTGFDVADRYDVVGINNRVYQSLSEKWFDQPSAEVLKDDYYVFFFKRVISGLPVRQRITAYADLKVDTVYPISANEQIVSYGKNGLREMTLSNDLEIQDAYGEKVEVADMQAVLSKLQEVIGNQLVTVVVYQIELCYGEDVIETDEGKRITVMKPYWYIQYSREAHDDVTLWLEADTCQESSTTF